MTSYKHYVNQFVWLEARTNEDIQQLIDSSKGLFNLVSFTLWRVTEHVEHQIGHFNFSPMPGCCGILISHDTWLNTNTRKTELSQPFRELKHRLAKDLGYTIMLATSQTKDIAAFSNLLKSKYQVATVFRNKRTTNDIAIGFKVL